MTPPDSLQVSDEQLKRLENLVRICTHPARHVVVHAEKELMPLVAELRTLRALLATPMPCGWEVPKPIADEPIQTLRKYVAPDFPALVEFVVDDELTLRLIPDDAIGVGAALIRAGLAAKERK